MLLLHAQIVHVLSRLAMRPSESEDRKSSGQFGRGSISRRLVEFAPIPVDVFQISRLDGDETRHDALPALGQQLQRLQPTGGFGVNSHENQPGDGQDEQQHRQDAQGKRMKVRTL